MKLTTEQKAWIVTYVDQQRTRAEDATRTFRLQWKELWQAYQSKQDYSGKASWQSKCFIPKVWMKIERAAGEIKRAMLQTKKLFKFELIDIEEKAQIAKLRTSMLDELDAERMGMIQTEIQKLERRIKAREEIKGIHEQQFKTAIAETNLVPVYSEMVKAAFLVSMGIPKVGWDVEKKRATFKHVNALNFRIDPDYEPSSDTPPKFVIEDYEQTILALKREAKNINAALKAADPKAEAAYDIGAINELGEGTTDLEKRLREQEQKGLEHTGSPKGTLQMSQFWGDIPNEDGDGWLAQNAMVIIANANTCVRVSANPFQHGRAPYQLTIPIVYPHRGCAGNSLAGPVVKINYTYNNLWNLFVDNLNFTVNTMFQGNPTHLLDAKDKSVYPGKFWAHNLGPSQTAISEVPVTPVQSDLLRALELIRQDMEEAMSVTRTLEGGSPAHKEPLGTTKLKTTQAQGFFDVIAWDLENTSLLPLLEMTYDLYVQFADYPARADNFRLRVGGISLMIQVQQMIDRIMQTLAVVGNAPPLAERTDVNWLWQRLLDLQSLSDAYVEPPHSNVQLSTQQQDAIAQRAEADAKRDVAAGKFSPQTPITGVPA